MRMEENAGTFSDVFDLCLVESTNAELRIQRAECS